MSKQLIIKHPSEWILTRHGDFIRIKNSQKLVDSKLEKIREHLQVPYEGKIRFKKKSPEQIVKERYDGVLSEVDFDYEKLHDWLYEPKNQDKIEKIKLEGRDYQETKAVIFNHIKKSKQKWRDKKIRNSERALVNEETGQVIYLSANDFNIKYYKVRIKFPLLEIKLSYNINIVNILLFLIMKKQKIILHTVI